MDTRTTSEYLDTIQSRVEQKLGQLYVRHKRVSSEQKGQLGVSISNCERALDELASLRPLLYRVGI